MEGMKAVEMRGNMERRRRGSDGSNTKKCVEKLRVEGIRRSGELE